MRMKRKEEGREEGKEREWEGNTLGHLRVIKSKVRSAHTQPGGRAVLGND